MIGRYFHTIRHLRPVQTFGRVLFRLRRPRPDIRPPPPRREPENPLVRPPSREPSLVGEDRFRILNREADIRAPRDWNRTDLPLLWLYNLHYFHCLVDPCDDEEAVRRRVELMRRWIRDNPPGHGVGWRPYPTSIRIVRWIQWALMGRPFPDEAGESLAVQLRWLRKRLEFHHQGNHLLANAKALVAGGLFFEGPEAERWLALGSEILERQVREQVLADGGHVERSPMYHALVLEDFLDLLALARALNRNGDPSWAETAESMAGWLRLMIHPDGDISFFNDAAVGVASEVDDLWAYSAALGVATPKPEHTLESGGVRAWHLEASGYIRLESAGAVAILDVAPLSADHLMAHGHADTLTFELSVQKQRVVVNGGSSTYEASPRRIRERGTASHNTVTVDGRDSSEVWKSFRVARRARVTSVELGAARDGEGVQVEAAHDGYRRQGMGVVHRRCWSMAAGSLDVRDRVEGTGSRIVRSFLHLHPRWRVTDHGDGSWSLEAGPVPEARGSALRVATSLSGGVCWQWRQGEHRPEFGRVEASSMLVGIRDARLPVEMGYTLTWSDRDAHP